MEIEGVAVIDENQNVRESRSVLRLLFDCRGAHLLPSVLPLVVDHISYLNELEWGCGHGRRISSVSCLLVVVLYFGVNRFAVEPKPEIRLVLHCYIKAIFQEEK